MHVVTRREMVNENPCLSDTNILDILSMETFGTPQYSLVQRRVQKQDGLVPNREKR